MIKTNNMHDAANQLFDEVENYKVWAYVLKELSLTLSMNNYSQNYRAYLIFHTLLPYLLKTFFAVLVERS